MAERVGYIYGLRDPHTNELRYVGKTMVDPRVRAQGHQAGAHNGSTMRVAHWLRSLGTDPVVTVFAENVPESIIELTEASYIRWMRSAGHPLLNSTLRREVTDA